MTEIFDRPYECAAAWKGPELAHSSEWIYTLSPDDVAEIDDAVERVRANGLGIPDISRADFPLPRLSAALADILHEIETGRGFALIRGLPVERLGEHDAAIAYWGIGTCLGEVPAQNMMGHRVAHVRAVGGDWDGNFNIRGYQTTSHLPYHSDKGDVAGLLCLHTAKAGGLSCIASSVAIHNEILRTRPDLHQVLYRPFYIDHRGEELDGGDPYYTAPIFAAHKGRFFARFGMKYVESAQRFPEVPRLSAAQTAAMQLFHDLAMSDEFRLDMEFRQGDIQFLNNHLIVHSRTDYEDYPEPERRRHLLRMLLLTPGFTDLPDFARNLNDFIRAWGENPRQSVLAESEEGF